MDMGRKILDVYENDPVLGVVLIPFGIVFSIWLLIRDTETAEVLLYTSIAVGMVSIASAAKHITLGWLGAKYGVIANAQVMQRKADEKHKEIIEIEAIANGTKDLAEKHWQMEISMLMAQNSNLAANSILARGIDYMKKGGEDADVLKLLAETAKDMQNSMLEQVTNIDLPFKEYVVKLFPAVTEAAIKNIPSVVLSKGDLTIEKVREQVEKVESINPETKDMAEISEEPPTE